MKICKNSYSSSLIWDLNSSFYSRYMKKKKLTRTVTPGTFAFDNGTDTTRLGTAVDTVEADDDATVDATTLYEGEFCSRTSFVDNLTRGDWIVEVWVITCCFIDDMAVGVVCWAGTFGLRFCKFGSVTVCVVVGGVVDDAMDIASVFCWNEKFDIRIRIGNIFISRWYLSRFCFLCFLPNVIFS